MKKGMNFIEATMKHYQIVVSIVVVLMILGAIGLKNMPRQEFPEFTVRQGIVVGVYPGFTSQEVEERLTQKVEDYIFGYEEVNKTKTYSHSKEGQMIIYVELNSNVKNADKFWTKLRHGLNELQVPNGVLALIGTNDFGDTSALLITMSSDQKTYRELGEIMKNLEAEVRKIPAVSKIKSFGEQKEEIYVYIKPEKLKQFNLKPTTVLASFQLQESINFSGTLDNSDLELPIHLPPRFESVEDLEEQIVYSDPLGNIIRLKDVAYIEKRYEKSENYIRNNGANALLLSLEMQKGNNIVHFGEDVQEVLSKFLKNTDSDVKLNTISNLPEVVDDSISHFLMEFMIAIIAVIIVTMLLLPFRVAAVAAVSIPISILITIGIMQMAGLQLHIVTLAALIVVLGMVVDNAIVVIDSHVEKLDHGDTPWNAAWKAATELFIPVLTASAAICAAFFPLLFFLTGIADDFVGSLPVTIGIALTVSMLVAVLLVPFMCFVFIKKGLHQESKSDESTQKKSLLDRVQNVFDNALSFCFRNPKLTILGGVLSIVFGVLFLMNVDQKLFPEMERKQFAIEVYLPEGASIKKTENVIDSLETILSKDKRITNIASFIGNGSPRFNALYAPHLPAKNYGQLLLNTTSNEATIAIINEYSAKYKNAFPTAHVKWKQLAMEDFKAPIEVRIASNNSRDLKTVGNQVTAILKATKNIDWVRSDWNEKRQGISVELYKHKANQLGYAKSLVASSLLISLDGMPLTTVWEEDYPISVMLSKEDYQKNSIDDLENQYVTSPLTLETLPLRAIGELKPEWTEGTIVRRNGVRTNTILGDIVRGGVANTIFSDVRPLIDALELPEGTSISYGGDYEATLDNFIPMSYSLGVSIIIIFFILMFQFKTVRKSLLIMSTMLLSIFGAGLGLWLMNYPFSLTAFIGVMGLVGIVVRNGIILIDYASHLVHSQNMSYKEAGLAAGKRRMRPIFLTSLAAAVGVIPMILSGSPLWGPLGTVICFGLLTGMVLTLLVLPVLYWKSVGAAEERKAAKALNVN
ncbi:MULTISPECIES: efflux RND transporter permease subunit [Flavobacteriaceae]|uniref:Efflux RND transporter permease subunit n=2 Tax=Flavobacteriaceae TaxID=49546 RepID=A0A4Y8AVD7_9FLAO|nr:MULTISPECIES: efflux RND transporter permease subunit [Flavobacteriaceae]TEW76487.1 efflux RND transporter permease subunit [Gramella jeungdoensis]GGK53355.1 multidrug transporter AcrB [Lutibacter litoralis]